MPVRVAVFIDYQNVYKRAREAFSHANEWHVHGQIRPVAAGLILRGDKDSGRDLVAVHTYRGLPSTKHDPKGYDAAQRQMASWAASGEIVHPHFRPLNYRDPSNPREKGIDVMLAIDFVRFAIQGAYDVGVIFSDDTDLHPALEAVGEIRGPGHAELATWADRSRSGPRVVKSGGENVKVHVLDATCYSRIRDTQDYNVGTARKPRPPRRRT